jgi:solute carrier family 25 protein 34/35
MSTTLGSFIAGGIAACGAVTVTHSFETVKIRLQLQGELQAKKDAPRLYRGVLHGVGVIYKNEGMKGLLRGLNCAVRTYQPPCMNQLLMNIAVHLPSHA